jgi:3-oxoacyl-[acyl-carrier-protein] synthase-3
MALPANEVSNVDLESRFDTSDQWIVERTGIRTRRVAWGPFAPDPPPAYPIGGLGTTAALAIEAGRDALERSSVSGDQISMLVLCTSTPDQSLPATSAVVAAALGIGGGAMDLNAACAGFTYGLITAAGLLGTGAEFVLLIGAETMTRTVDWDDRTTAFLFGDGAGAVVLQRVTGPGSLLAWDVGVDGTLVDLLYADHGAKLVMNGREVFRKAVRAVVCSANDALTKAGLDASDVTLFVPHQANFRIMEAVSERLGIPIEKVASVIDWTGNTSSASIPLALFDSVKKNRLARGDIALLSGFGAGMTWASAVWRWDGTAASS